MHKPRIAYFGGEPLGVTVLEELKTAGILPELIICNPDRPSGRGLQLTKPPVKVWAEAAEIEVFQPTSFKDRARLNKLLTEDWDLFVVVAYNFILPKWLLNIPKHGVINVHPSLLPKLRGASPIRTAILEGKREDIGVTIMLMDEKMDHGPVLQQLAFPINNEDWPVAGPELDHSLAHLGGFLLATTIPSWLAGEITPQEQNHSIATYTKRLTKEDALLNIDPNQLPRDQEAKEVLQKISAFAGIGDSFFMYNEKRIKVKSATLSDEGLLQLVSVVPEGKKQMSFESYLQSLV